MTKILIAADLHLSIAEKSYSFSVFDEILENAKNYDALFLLGDTFNTFEDAEKLKEEFSKKSEIYNKNIYLLKGNHEYLKSGGINLSKLKFADNIKIIENIDFINLDNYKDKEYYLKKIQDKELIYQNEYINPYDNTKVIFLEFCNK